MSNKELKNILSLNYENLLISIKFRSGKSRNNSDFVELYINFS